jgi:hypothetical protein
MRRWYPQHIHMLRIGPDVGKAPPAQTTKKAKE